MFTYKELKEQLGNLTGKELERVVIVSIKSHKSTELLEVEKLTIENDYVISPILEVDYTKM